MLVLWLKKLKEWHTATCSATGSESLTKSVSYRFWWVKRGYVYTEILQWSLWKCLSTVREASGVTRYGKLGWHWRPRRVPNQSCYGYHQISHGGDAMEIFVIAPYASGYLWRLVTFIYWSLLNFWCLWYAIFLFFILNFRIVVRKSVIGFGINEDQPFYQNVEASSI